MVQDQQNVYTVRTLECDICQRFDSLLMTELELKERVERNSLQIGSRLVNHGNHLRIIYFDIEGNFLGDTMSLNISDKNKTLNSTDVPMLLKSKESIGIHRKMLKFLSTKSYEISIIGPSMAGKTSLAKFLGTGIPERVSHRINHPPTMGQSTKRVELSSNKLLIHDMGGQKDFWGLWKNHFGKVSHIIYVIDGAANHQDAIEGLELLFNFIEEQRLLIVFNKYDLLLDGYCQDFLQPRELLDQVDIPNKSKLWITITSVYNGLGYHYTDDQQETPLSEIILDFLER